MIAQKVGSEVSLLLGSSVLYLRLYPQCFYRVHFDVRHFFISNTFFFFNTISAVIGTQYIDPQGSFIFHKVILGFLIIKFRGKIKVSSSYL